MQFITLVYHEVRDVLPPSGLPIHVADGYHDTLPEQLYLAKDDFEAHIKKLVEFNYNFISITDVLSWQQGKFILPENAILLTIDDCFQSLYYEIYPVLKHYKIPATVFVPSGWIFSKSSSYNRTHSQTLSFDELDAMRTLLTYANHGHHMHQRHALRGVMQDASLSEIGADLKSCSRFVDVPLVFAYPFGFYDNQLRDVLATLDVKIAFTTQSGINTHATNPLEMHRILVTRNMSALELVSQIERLSHEKNR